MRVYTPGVWDILHSGHINLISKAKSYGDHLIVGVCSDRLTEIHKGRPTNNQQERSRLISSLKPVDEVYVYDDADQSSTLSLFNVDVFVIGEDFGKQGVPEHEKALAYCVENKIDIVRLPRTPGISSSSKKEDVIKKFWSDRAVKLKQGELGQFQSTSLTSTEEAAETRKEKDLQFILTALGKATCARDKVIELGCGVGRVTFEIAGLFQHTYANDYIQEFIDVAKEKQANITFVCEEAHAFEKLNYDCCVIAGLFVCLTDEQLAKVIDAISYIPSIVVKESVGTFARYELQDDHFSEQLKANYTATYRTTADIIDIFASKGYVARYTEVVEQHRKETHIRVFLFEKLG